MKSLLSLIITILLISSSFAQQIEKVFNFDYSLITSVAADKNNIYAAGAYNPPGSFRLSDGYIVKMDENLDTLWQRTFGASLIDKINDIILFDGKIYAVGISWRPEYEHRKSQAWLLVLDTAGNLIYQKLYGDKDQDAANAIIPTDDGNLLITGEYGQGGDQNVWLLKIKPDGTIIWDKKFGKLTDYETGVNICPVKDGYLILAKTIIKGRNNSDAWILKVNKQGDMIWDRTFPIYENNYFHSCIKNDMGCLLIGNTAVKNKTKKADLWLMQISDKGASTNDKTIGTYMYEWSYKALQKDDKIYIFGTFSNQLKGEIWTIDMYGNLLSQKTLDLPTIYGAAKFDDGFVIGGGHKNKGYVAIIK